MFHVWNGKRLRPRALGPFDYEAENYTRSLWFVEGVTSYYDDLLVARAGLNDGDDYLRRVSKVIDDVQTTPGRLLQALDDASFDAWIKLYRRDENTPNQAVSYYRKGQLVAWLLDVRLRRASGGEVSLDDLLRAAYGRWSGEHGYTPPDLLALVAEIGDADVAAWLDRTLTHGGELDFAPALEWLGLRFTEMEDKNGGGKGAAGDGDESEEEPAGWLGADAEVRKGRLLVTAVRRGTPAFDAGLNVDDEILAVDDFRVSPDGLEERLKQYRPSAAAELLVARRGRLLRLPVTFGEEPSRPWKLEVDPEAGEEAAARRAAWLGAAGQAEAAAAQD
jgi:predicted metalloprotease with PDZ domain